MDKPMVWLADGIKTPPFSAEARIEVGSLLRKLQQGNLLSLPHSRPMPVLGARCHELRVRDSAHQWRIMYRVDPDAIVVMEVFGKKSRGTPQQVIRLCQRRLRDYDAVAQGRKEG